MENKEKKASDFSHDHNTIPGRGLKLVLEHNLWTNWGGDLFSLRILAIILYHPS